MAAELPLLRDERRWARLNTDLAAASAFAATEEQRAAAVFEIGFGERERFLNE